MMLFSVSCCFVQFSSSALSYLQFSFGVSFAPRSIQSQRLRYKITTTMATNAPSMQAAKNSDRLTDEGGGKR
jgi:hypothetical protein